MYRIWILILLAFGIVQCTTDTKSGAYGLYSDNLESLKGVDNKLTGRKDFFRVGDLPQVQRDTVKSGKIALRLNPQFPYGLNYPIPNVRTDEFVEISVWYTGPGQVVLVASHTDAKYFYRKSSSIISDDSEWKELRLSLSIPPNMNKEDLNIYLWNPGKEPVYVDDFKLSYKRFKSYPTFQVAEGLHLLIDTVDMIRLEQKRENAFVNGILETEDEDYVPGIMYYKDSIMPVELRLKGDWLDHLEGRKWSFRIKVKKQNTWNSVKAFSIHSPVARDFLNEYVSHQLFRSADNLAPRYGFVPVSLNGTSLGVYAWEEHFEKQMVEAMNRREGPILKFEEGSFWQSQKVFLQDTQYFELPFLETSDILPFKINRTLADTVLKQNFNIAHNLLHQYRQGLKPVSEIFDIKKLAGYYALMDLTRGFHGNTWHNQRYYYNPILCKLEPIFFDAYTEVGVFNPERNAVAGLFNFDPNLEKRFENLFWVRLFQDPIFLQEYTRWLEEISDPVWINDFLQREENSISSFENLLQMEFVEYRYDRGFLLENARKIRSELPFFKAKISENPNYADFDQNIIQYLNYTNQYDPRFPAFYVNSYLQDSSSNGYQIQVDNFYPIGIEIIGYGITERVMDSEFDKPFSIDAFNKIKPVTSNLDIPINNGYLFFTVQGFDDRFSSMINSFSAAIDYTPEQELFGDLSTLDLPFTRLDGNKIVFTTGKHIITEPIIIPSGYDVVFESSCEMDFVLGSFFISKSNIVMKGDKMNPIIISSSDNSSNGFTVIQANGTCILDNVVFKGLNTLSYNGWQLTGAVNFYESNVEINNSEFQGNVCEDGLNIIRSDFKVSNSQFSDTFADAFDSDFCTGIVSNVNFNNIGNDAIDFSGSQVEIRDCEIMDIGDKGVSAGENSTLSVSGTQVIRANIGFAAKDKSILELKDCEANTTIYGIVAFQKKPEYGPGQVKTSGFNAKGVSTIYLIERFSKLNLNGTFIQGESVNLAALFY